MAQHAISFEINWICTVSKENVPMQNESLDTLLDNYGTERDPNTNPE